MTLNQAYSYWSDFCPLMAHLVEFGLDGSLPTAPRLFGLCSLVQLRNGSACLIIEGILLTHR